MRVLQSQTSSRRLMRSIFVDTGYLIAVISPRDGLHHKAKAAVGQLGPCRLVTSEMVLVEFLNMFAEKGPDLREAAVKAVQAITNNASIDVVPQTRQLFQEALV
jgi:predicted nucleic acid-binding protein